MTTTVVRRLLPKVPLQDEVNEIRSFVFFLTYVLRTLGEASTKKPRRLRLDFITDQSDEEILDHMTLRYPKHWAQNDSERFREASRRKSFDPGVENKMLLFDTIGLLYSAFEKVIKRVLHKDRAKFENILNLYEIRYRLDRMELDLDGPGLLVDTPCWFIGYDYLRGLGREYQMEARDIVMRNGFFYTGEVISRRYQGKKFGFRDRVVIDKGNPFASLQDLGDPNDPQYDHIDSEIGGSDFDNTDEEDLESNDS